MAFTTARSPFVQFMLLSLRPYFREPHVLFWVFGFPILLTFVLALAFSSGTGKSNLTLAVYAPPATDAAWLAELRKASEIKIIDVPEGALSQTGPELGETLSAVKSVAELPSGLKQIFLVQNADVLLANGEVYSIRGQSQFQAQWDQLLAYKAKSMGQIANEHHISVPGVRYVDWFVPGMLGLSMLSNGLFGVTFTIVSNREQGFYKRLRLAPFRKQTYIAGFSVARLIMVCVQILVLLAFFNLVYGFKVQGNFFSFFGVCLLLSFCMNVLGVAIGARIRKTEIAGGFTNLFFFPFSLLGGIYFKSEYFPDWVQTPIRFIPLKAGVDMLRDIANKAMPLSHYGFELSVLVVWSVGCLMFAAKYFDWGTEA